MLAVVWLIHATILRSAANLLILDERGEVEWLCVCDPDADRCFEQAAQWYHDGPSRRILLISPPPNRLAQIGIRPSLEVLGVEALVARGVPRPAIHAIRSDWQEDWAIARVLDRWLAEHHDVTCGLLCQQFRSAHMRRVLERVLGGEKVQRVRVRSLVDRRFNESNWWTSRCGNREFGFGCLLRFHSIFLGGSANRPSQENAAEYEQRFLAGFGARE